MSSKKDNSIWSMSYTYKLTPESQKYFFDYATQSTAQQRHAIEKEMELLRDIDNWVEIMDSYPEAEQIIKKIQGK